MHLRANQFKAAACLTLNCLVYVRSLYRYQAQVCPTTSCPLFSCKNKKNSIHNIKCLVWASAYIIFCFFDWIVSKEKVILCSYVSACWETSWPYQMMARDGHWQLAPDNNLTTCTSCSAYCPESVNRPIESLVLVGHKAGDFIHDTVVYFIMDSVALTAKWYLMPP